MEGLNTLEQAVLDKLLAGDHPVLITLRAQAERAHVTRREYTGVGFFCDFEVPSDLRPLAAGSNFRVGDVNASLDGLEHGAGFVLVVRDGRLATLEGYTYEEPWPPEVRNLKLTYQREPRELPFRDSLA
jgi:hypothetical protein